MSQNPVGGFCFIATFILLLKSFVPDASAQSNTCITLFCPANIVAATCSNCAPVYYTARASDSCCASNGNTGLTLSYNPPSGSCFPIGTNVVQITAIDNCQNTATCSFTVTVNPGIGLQVRCPTNKTVSCGSNWTFDLPQARTCCTNQFLTSAGMTNLMVSSLGVVSNGYCPTVYTETWEITDACGDTNTCSQSVTVIGAPATVVCSSNKTVPCGTTWSFDPPTITGGCGGTNVVALTPVTNGACPLYITETWLISDACGNNYNCSQIVTVVGAPGTVICPTNKTVQCSSVWSFDPPTVIGGCGGSNIITAQAPITNGVCPKYVTETWQIINVCAGLSNSCSQTVTVVDTTPPILLCPSGAYTVPLNHNCQLVIPQIVLPVADNCTPSALITFHQTPPAGTVLLSGHSANVTVTATDGCGNSSSCSVQVIGTPTGPVLSGPTSLVVTNCEVPCVLNLVGVADSCCPAGSITLTQSPPCNAPLGPGINSVTVTATDCNGLTAVHVISLNIAGPISFLGGLYNTGVNTNYSLLPYGNIDAHWAGINISPGIYETNGSPYFYGYLYAVSQGTVCYPSPSTSICGPMAQTSPGCFMFTPWGLNSAASEWISFDYTNNVCWSAGDWLALTAFNLPAGANPATASISGRWAADDIGSMYLNGLSIAQLVSSIGAPSGGSGYQSWHSFTIPPGAGFLASNNLIEIIITNTAPYTGLRVEFTNALVNCQTCAPPAVISMTPGVTLPQLANATFQVIAAGTPPLTYQWFHNATPLTNSAHYSGATTSVLQVIALGLADAGAYSVQITGPCGSVSATNHLVVSNPRQIATGSWTIGLRTAPLGATLGPDLTLVSGSVYGGNYTITTGTTLDFGLPTLDGQVVNVMDIAPLPSDTSIQVPVIAPPGSNNVPACTVLMDIYQPDTSFGTPATLFSSIYQSSSGDGVNLITDTQNLLHINGSLSGVPFDAATSSPLLPDVWNRLAFVINPLDATDVTVSLYVNGLPGAAITVTVTNNGVPTGISPNWTVGPPAFFSSTSGVTAEFYVAGLQFIADAFQSAQIAGLGTPDSGALTINDTSLPGPSPVISASLAGGSVSLNWTGAPYVLQETTDLSTGQWTDSDLPVSESTVGNEIVTTAIAVPSVEQPCKFYRLIFRP
jgi:hypothetical protein